MPDMSTPMEEDTADAQRRRFALLYEQHKLHVLAYCVRRTGAADASDACSETFLVAWRRIGAVPAEPETLPYLYGIAAKVLSNQFRSIRRRRRLDDKLRGLGVQAVSDPSTVILRSTRSQEVLAAMRRLKPVDREILMLSAWEDLPRSVIAQMMGMTRAAVDQRIHRSYQRLAQILEPSTTTPAGPPPTLQTGGV